MVEKSNSVAGSWLPKDRERSPGHQGLGSSQHVSYCHQYHHYSGTMYICDDSAFVTKKPQAGDVRAGGSVDGRVPARLGFQGGASIERLYDDYDYDMVIIS